MAEKYAEKYGVSENDFTERVFQYWCGVMAIGGLVGFFVGSWFIAKGIVILKYKKEKKDEKLG